MAKLTNITIPDDLDAKITRLVDEGEFASREDAVQELLSNGLTAHRTDSTTNEDEFGTEFGEDEFTEPEYDDEYVF